VIAVKVLNITSHSEEQTEALAAKLAGLFGEQAVIVLTGELGSGKTVFVRGLARAKGLDADLVNSPSFTLVNEYPGKTSVYHFDLYRMESPSELYEIGLDEYLSRDGLVVIEWGEKAEPLLPKPHYLIDFEIVGDTDREINVSVTE
jgi:tRNA threonylcarbamoyladenosine biosynthesis protein TsaE